MTQHIVTLTDLYPDITPEDEKLIKEAENLPWWEIDEYAAHSKGGQEELHRIKRSKFHSEEYKAGML